jgi:lysophospholipase L1-like esterase
VDGFRVDTGRGLLKAEPLSSRKLEIFGDSVTSGSNARLTYWGYAFRLGRELDADVHVISKGGSGVSASFNNQDVLLNYWDKLSYPSIGNASTGLPWNFSWVPDGVINAIGHNDQYNGGQPAFPDRYADFIGELRTIYGANVPILGVNTIISSPVWHFERALAPLVATDPKLRWAHQLTPSAPVAGHPGTLGQGIMVFGDRDRFSMADLVEEMMGWGVAGP